MRWEEIILSEEKNVLYTRKYPTSDGGFNDQVQAMERAAAAGCEFTPRSSYCEGDVRKQFESHTGVKLGDQVTQAIVIVQED